MLAPFTYLKVISYQSIKGGFRLPLVICSLAVLLFVVSRSAAQEGTWNANVLCNSCSPEAFVVGDSLNLVVLTNQDGRIVSHITSNGGFSWDTSIFPNQNFVIVDYSFASFIPPSSYYFFSRPIVYYTNNLKEWNAGAVINDAKTGIMFNDNYGYWLVASTQGLTELRRTDFGPGPGSFTDRVAEWLRSPYAESTEIIDSLHILRTSVRELYLSSDRGLSWDTLRPLPVQSAIFSYSHVTRDANRFYVLGGRDTSGDFLYTSDGGTSWKESAGLTNRRILRLVEQDTNKIWLVVARKSKTYPSPNLLNRSLSSGQFADTLYYTGDGGSSWSKQTAFIGDTVFEMKWPSPSHGYVLSFRDSSVKLSRWRPSIAEVSYSGGFAKDQLYIYPNPVEHEFKFYPPLDGDCSIQVFDVFGREVLHQDVTTIKRQEYLLRMPAYLCAGYYLLQLAYNEGFATEGFVISR